MTSACSVGATIVCVDVLVRLFPGKEDFRIQDSNDFLACSLSLSFGVMVRLPLLRVQPGLVRAANIDGTALLSTV